MEVIDVCVLLLLYLQPQQILSTACVFENGLASGNGEVIDILASLMEDINQPLDSD